MAGLAMGRIASFYYLRHQTMAVFAQQLGPGMDVQVRRPAARVLQLRASIRTLPLPRCRHAQPAGPRPPRVLRAPLFCLQDLLPVLCAAAEHDELPSSQRGSLLALLQDLLPVLCAAAEYAELPVRHNEDKLNVQLARDVRWPTDPRTAGACRLRGQQGWLWA